jgi:hypothetical protein
MSSIYSSRATRELVLRFVLDSIDYRKKCLYLQDIIFLGKIDDAWSKVLARFFDIPLQILPLKVFNKN